VGIPGPEHFVLAQSPIAPTGDGQILVRNHLLSVDPAQRGWTNAEGNYSEPVALNTPMRALAVGEILESRAPELRVGEFVYGWFGWQSYCLTDGASVLRRVDTTQLPLSANLSLLGINGLTAYIALHTIGQPSPGETIIVTTAAGSVGSFVGQLSRAAGALAVGLTSTDEKVQIARDRYGYIEAINYRSPGALREIRGFCPEGADIFFDNTGGPIADEIIRLMRVNGRVIQCGTAATASWSQQVTGPRNEREVLTRRLRWQGFVIFDHAAQFPAAAKELTRLALAGKMVFDEEILFGLAEAPAALSRLYQGTNRGKLIIRLV
jgi:NADPH-dependent curcumin reductase CurA